MRILGIDYGTKNVGVAVGDTDTKLALPLMIIPRTREIVRDIRKLMHDEGVERVVVGAPTTFDGAEQSIAQVVAKFCGELRIEGVDVATEDERLTTRAVERSMNEMGKAAKGVDKDAAAAAMILQTYLDKLA
jgi:putative Holliday junction resolvase